jgi:hypothetical protein
MLVILIQKEESEIKRQFDKVRGTTFGIITRMRNVLCPTVPLGIIVEMRLTYLTHKAKAKKEHI